MISCGGLVAGGKRWLHCESSSNVGRKERWQGRGGEVELDGKGELVQPILGTLENFALHEQFLQYYLLKDQS